MSRNGSGIYTLNTAGQPIVSGTTITSTAFNLATADIATALTQSICVDGQSTITGNIPFAGHKATGLDTATATGDALSYGRAATVTSLTTTAGISVSQNQNATSTFPFVNTDTTNSSSRALLTVTAGTRFIGLEAIHADTNCYIQWTGGTGLFLNPDAGQNSPAVFAGSGMSAGRGNAAACAINVAKDGGTSRSINAEGTINASGADYAECEGIGDCGPLSKGQIIGFDEDGLITDKWDKAHSFGVVSTDPSFVGGDVFTGELGKNYERIAYSGKVPVNVFGVMPGQYIAAIRNGDGIAGCATFGPTSLPIVGRVRKIMGDGRAQISVIVS